MEYGDRILTYILELERVVVDTFNRYPNYTNHVVDLRLDCNRKMPLLKFFVLLLSVNFKKMGFFDCVIDLQYEPDVAFAELRVKKCKIVRKNYLYDLHS